MTMGARRGAGSSRLSICLWPNHPRDPLAQGLQGPIQFLQLKAQHRQVLAEADFRIPLSQHFAQHCRSGEVRYTSRASGCGSNSESFVFRLGETKRNQALSVCQQVHVILPRAVSTAANVFLGGSFFWTEDCVYWSHNPQPTLAVLLGEKTNRRPS